MADEAGTPWTGDEVTETVRAYFSMWKREQSGAPYVKSHENDKLRALLNGRSRAAVEYKFQNVSAVLMKHGWVPIRGYKPASNFQLLLERAVVAELQADSELDRVAAMALSRDTDLIAEPNLRFEVVPPPAIILPDDESWTAGGPGIRWDYLYRGAQNSRLGLAGELAAVEFEKCRLAARPDLAERVEHVSRTKGDGLGFDVLSFDQSGSELYIEVKTTRHARETPFFATRNEVRASAHLGEQYRVYRLFQFSTRKQGMYQLAGPLDRTCTLQPREFLAAPQ